MARRLTSWRPGLRALAILLPGLAVLGLAVFGAMHTLARMAISDGQRPRDGGVYKADLGQAGHTASFRRATSVEIGSRSGRSGVVRGHRAGVVTGRFTRDGHALVSVDVDGNVRLSGVRSMERQHAAAEFSFLDRLSDRLWRTYGKSLGQVSLTLLAPVITFHFQDCPTCPGMVVIPAGTFRMGSPADEKNRDDDEGPVHDVTIARPFAVARSEVTRAQYAAFIAATGRRDGGSCIAESAFGKADWEERQGRGWRSPVILQTDDHPVVCVDWKDAKKYALWLSKKTGYAYRLLTEAEWEYAARAGTMTPYSFGGDGNSQCTHANGVDASAKKVYGRQSWTFADCADSYVHTAPVNQFLANPFALHDMQGNVWEWVEDCYKDSYQGAPSNGAAVTPSKCDLRVLRGGSWGDNPQNLRSAYRVRNRPVDRIDLIGFRLARTLNP